jgi:cell division protein WhiA
VPDPLAAAGTLRLARPELGLADLAAHADPPLSKDALAGRLRRLLALANRHR